MTENKGILGALALGVVLIVLFNVIAFSYFSTDNTVVEEKLDTLIELATPIINEGTVPITEDVIEDVEVEEDVSETTFLYEQSYEYERDETESEALELATESIESRDFKEAVFDLLVNDTGLNTIAIVNIDDYKDITEIDVLDIDFNGKKKVTFELKVYYFLDGDEDETERARLEEFTILINDLDFDDDFEDAEVDDSYMDTLTLQRIYD